MIKISEILESFAGKTIAIDDVVTTFSDREASHKSAWTYMLASQLKSIGISATVLTKHDNVHDFDVWMIALPMEFAGSYNLFGGANDEPAARIQRLLDYKGQLYCINREAPKVGAFVESRLKSCSDNWRALDIPQLNNICENIETIDLTLDSSTFILGDSHSVSVYVPGSNISRNDGKTLFGIMKEGMNTYIPEGTDHLISYFGNIDVRHHLCRQSNPLESVKKLVADYFEHLKSLNIKKIEVVKLLPIEFEGRRIPKTGWYKDAPFAGTQVERTQLMELFNSEVDGLSKEYGFGVISWPSSWYDINPELFANKYMERPGSVHLSREFYQYDFITNKENMSLKKTINSLF
jgi:hypothetical protein